MPIFENARDFSIYNSTFIDQGSKVDPLKSLTDRVIWGAMHDADDRYDPPRVHPQTRTAILDRIERWASGSSEHPIMWLNGPAGAGKSAIAQTLAERWSQAGVLGASFFMQRTAVGRNSREFLAPTLAYQFTVHNTGARAHVKSVLTADSQLFERSLVTQLDKLIADCLEAAELEDGPGAIQVIIIDGLDECCVAYKSQTHEEQQKQILEAIASISRRKLPLRFLIASRPEVQIRYSFSTGSLLESTEYVTLSGGSEAEADIALFLECKFSEIRANHPFLDRSWPSRKALEKLIRNSSGHFVYPSTVVRHLSSLRINPDEALDSILDLEKTDESKPLLSSERSDATTAQPLAQLDALYMHILKTAIPHIQSRPFAIIQLMLTGDRSLREFDNISALAELWSTTSGQIHTDLADLHSLLEIPGDHSSILQFHHASFGEFMNDPQRSGYFWAGGPFTLPLQPKLLDLSMKRFRESGGGLPSDLMVDALDRGLGASATRLGKLKWPGIALQIPIFLLQVVLMTNPREIVARPIPWLWYISRRNARVLVSYLSIIGIFSSFALISRRGLERDWPQVVSFTTLQTVRVLMFIHISIVSLRFLLSSTPSLYTFPPNILELFNTLILLLSGCSTVICYTYLYHLVIFCFMAYLIVNLPE